MPKEETEIKHKEVSRKVAQKVKEYFQNLENSIKQQRQNQNGKTS